MFSSTVFRRCLAGRYFAFAVLVLCATAMPVWGAGEPAPGAATATTVKLPDGPGSVRGLSDSADVNVFSSQLGYTLPIDLPKGLGGMTPSLGLHYSGDLGNGPLGVGWTLPIASIRRSTRHGVPSYTSGDELELVGIGGGGRLVKLVDGTWVLEGRSRQIKVETLESGGFLVTENGGVKYRLGISAASRQGDGPRTFAWLLEEAEHPTKATIRYEYLHDEGEVYLHRINWGPGDVYRVAILTEPRHDTAVSFRSGFKVRTARRVQSIQVHSHGELQRVYQLGYGDTLADDTLFGLSRLRRVQMFGRAPESSLPPVTFEYAAPSLPVIQQASGVEGWVLNDDGVSLMDVDGDGTVDLLHLGVEQDFFKRGQAGGFGPKLPILGATQAWLASSRLVDVDGDTRPELVRSFNETLQVSKLNGNTFGPAAPWQGGQGLPLFRQNVAFADLNGDGWIDYIWGGSEGMSVHFGGPGGLSPPTNTPPIDGVSLQPGPNVRFHDVNGDGLADVVQLAGGWWRVFLGRGDGTFAFGGEYKYPWGESTSLQDLRLGDLNRDGLLDLIHIQSGYVRWYRGVAGGGVEPTYREVPRPGDDGYATVITIADVNGNGSQDVVWSNVTGMWILDIAGPTSAGMLVGIHNGMGKAVKVEYAASATLSLAAEVAGNAWQRLLPMVIPVPTALEVSPGGGAPARRVEYSVRDGFWDFEERRFGGFLRSQVRTVGSDPGDTLEEETSYHAGEGADRQLRGRAHEVVRRDGHGALFTRAVSQWAVLSVTGLVAAAPAESRLLGVPVVLSKKTFNHQGVTDPLETLVTYDYDGRARLIGEDHFGRIDLPDDQFAVRRTYTHDDALWVHDLVCEERVYGATQSQTRGVVHLDVDPAPRSHQRHYYGDKTTKNAWSQTAYCVPGRGLLRETVGLLNDANGSRWVSTVAKEYDDQDNVIVAIEGGVRRELAYSSDGLFPQSETLRPDTNRTLVWSVTELDRVLGVATEITDPSGAVFQITYDGVGRATSVAVDGKEPHLRHAYEWDQPSGSSAWLARTWTWTFDGDHDDVGGTWGPSGPVGGAKWRVSLGAVNGAGEQVYSAVRLEAGKWLVSGHRVYDHRGLVTQVANGYEIGLPGVQPPVAVPKQVLVHDALGRLVSQTLPTLAAKVVDYAAFQVTSTTQGLAPVVTRTDGLDRIIRTERAVNGSTESVDALYDALGRITSLEINGGAATHSFTYDTLGRLVAATDPDIGDRTLGYNDFGWLLTHTNGAGQQRSFAYDAIGRLTQTSGDGGSYTYHYDFAAPGRPATYLGGRLSWVAEPRGQVHLSYDAFGRQIRQWRRIDGEWADESVRMSPSGLPLFREMDGLQVPYTHDAAGRLTAIGNYWQAASLDASGRILNETYGNGIVQTYGRDPLGLPQSISVANGTASLYEVTVGRNAWGAPSWVQDHDGVGLNHSSAFTYDGAARLTNAIIGAQGQGANLTAGANSYVFNQQYSALQNMTSRTMSGPAAVDALWGEYHYGERLHGPRQLSRVENSSGDVELDYDAAGRVISIGTDSNRRVLDYNGLDQLVAASIPGPAGAQQVLHSYGYDGLRTVTEGAGVPRVWFTPNLVHQGVGRQWYLKDGSRTIVRLDLAPLPQPGASRVVGGESSSRILAGLGKAVGGAIASLSLLAGLVVAAVAIRSRVRPRAALGTGVLVAAVLVSSCRTPVESTSAASARSSALWEVAEATYFHGGLSAGPQLLTRQDGSVFEERRYEPFGAPIDAYSQPANGGPAVVGGVNFSAEPLNVLNKETEPVSGFSYHGARWMAPQSAMWLTPDPPVKAPEPRFLWEPWALHPYQYVLQNPVVFWDPDGHQERPSNATDYGDPALNEARSFSFRTQALPVREGMAKNVAPVARQIITLNPLFAASEAITGKGVATGEQVSTDERVLTGGGLILPLLGKLFKAVKAPGVAGAVAGVPGRVQSRINLRNGSVAEGAGWNHVVDRHFNPAKNASQFTISQSDLRAVLQRKEVVHSPVTRVLESRDGVRYVRELTFDVPIGVDKYSGFQPTSTMTVLTDEYGNLVTATPGLIK